VLHAVPLPHSAVLAKVKNIWIKPQRPVEQLVHLDTSLIAQTAYAHSVALDVSLAHQPCFALDVMEQLDISWLKAFVLSARVHVLHACQMSRNASC